MDRHPGLTPWPLGKIIPSLEGSYSYNTDHTPDWLMTYCPGCGSDHVCTLDPEYSGYGRVWFCISCQDSWEYISDECAK